MSETCDGCEKNLAKRKEFRTVRRSALGGVPVYRKRVVVLPSQVVVSFEIRGSPQGFTLKGFPGPRGVVLRLCESCASIGLLEAITVAITKRFERGFSTGNEVK